MAKNSKQPGLNYGQNDTTAQGPVECLGQTFPNDEARRAHFIDLLRKKLKDPAFRKIEGFPIGDDEDILALSDPPYYTACPNPFVPDFISRYSRPFVPTTDSYRREPFFADVSEGKNDPIYNAHPYHTKVPPKAIQRYIEHYTEPGDIILDFTCGTGMTGVASHLSSKTSPNPRRTILCDLSPVATWIAYGLNRLITPSTCAESKDLLDEVQCNASSLYTTTWERKERTLLYLVWSDMLLCPHCGTSFAFWDAAIDSVEGEIHDVFSCPGCSAEVTKRQCTVATTAEYDPALKKTVAHALRVPVIAVFQQGSRNERHLISKNERGLFRDIDNRHVPDVPRTRIDKDLDIWWDRDYRQYGIYSIDRFFTNRALKALADAKDAFRSHSNYRTGHFGMWVLTAILRDCSLMTGLDIKKYFHGGGGPFAGGVKGTYFIPSLAVEKNAAFAIHNRIESLESVASELGHLESFGALITTQSATQLSAIAQDTIDYIFVDPPFGSNFIYSELNTIHEAWLGVSTATDKEAVMHRRRKETRTSLEMYQELMRDCFSEAFRVLKPGRWMTVEFSNTQAAVWNALQTALQESGFVVANVAALDKQQGSFKAVTTTTAVKQDLVISVYKPTHKFEERFSLIATTEAGAWEFVRNHLSQLPVAVEKGGRIEIVAERQKHMLFDRLIALYIQRGLALPLSAPEFYSGLTQKYSERDGMYFLPEQAHEYDLARMKSSDVEQLELFVSDEKSAIQWVRQHLGDKGTTYQELAPNYMKEAQRLWEKHEQPIELMTILRENFIQGPGGRWCVPDKNNEAHITQLRHRMLLKEFQQYSDSKGRIKVIRTEALRAGFKECWSTQDYKTIRQVADRVPESVFLDDSILLMYLDNAKLRAGE